ncbi:MAG: cellulase family glycosylhydrolase [Phycisphaerae bacterium]
MMPIQQGLPRWRGFNLLEAFSVTSRGDFIEDDFRLIADWGFDFVRLPMAYTLWIEKGDVYRLKESMLAKIDRAVDWGQRYGLHVCLNFHRAPGYSVNAERPEPFNLWKDQAACEAFCFHWGAFAKRYKGIDSGHLSFNLVNEPANPSFTGMTRQDHERVIRAGYAAIKQADPHRLVIMDGLNWGTMPCPELADLPLAQSCRAYLPGGVSHYQANWVDSSAFPVPVWPGGVNWDLTPWDRAMLEEFYRPWGELARQGVGVHCGEGGAFKYTPHAVVLAWLRDVLEILTSLNIGMALWNFRGAFGVLDSERSDVAYESVQGHQLDRKLLSLLQEF